MKLTQTNLSLIYPLKK